VHNHVTEIARQVISDGHVISIRLQRDVDTRREVSIAFVWPPQPVLIEPAQLTMVTAAIAIIGALAQARIELVRLRAAELPIYNQTDEGAPPSAVGLLSLARQAPRTCMPTSQPVANLGQRWNAGKSGLGSITST
jgi:hypothetical protein